MPSLLPCTCGKTLKIPDGIPPGTRVKCKNCMTVLVVGGAKAKDGGGRAGAPSTPGKGPPAERAASAGKPVVKKPVPPPPADEDDDDDEVEERVTARKPAAKAPPVKASAKKPVLRDEDDEGDEDDTPPSRSSRAAKPAKKGGSLMPILLASLVGLLLIGGGAAAYIFLFSGPSTGPIAKNNPAMPPPGPGAVPPGMNPPGVDPMNDGANNSNELKEVSELPVGSVGFVQLRVGDWWNGESGKKFQETKYGKMVEEMKDKLSLSPADVNFVRIALPQTQTANPTEYVPKFAVISFLRDMDWDKLQGTLPGVGPKQTMGEKSYFSIDQSKPDAPSLVPVTPRVAAVVDPKNLPDYLEGKLAFQPGTFGPSLTEASKHHVYVAYDVPQALVEIGSKMAGPQKEWEALKDTKRVLVKIHDGSPLNVELQLTFGDEKNAAELQKTAEAMLPFAENMLGVIANGPDSKKDLATKSIFDAGLGGVKNLKLTNQGKVLTATTSMDLTLGSMLPMLFDRFGQGAPLGGPSKILNKKD